MSLANAAGHTVVRVKFPALHTRISFAAPHQVNAPIPRGANEMKSDEISYTKSGAPIKRTLPLRPLIG